MGQREGREGEGRGGQACVPDAIPPSRRGDSCLTSWGRHPQGLSPPSGGVRGVGQAQARGRWEPQQPGGALSRQPPTSQSLGPIPGTITDLVLFAVSQTSQSCHFCPRVPRFLGLYLIFLS